MAPSIGDNHSYRGGGDTTYRQRFQEFKSADTERNRFINQLLEELETLRAENQDLAKDLDREKVRVFGLRNDAAQSRRDSIGRNFVLVLLDADAEDYVFQQRFLDRDAEGGKEAADELFRSVKEYLNVLKLDGESTDVVVRAYANLKGLQSACVQNKKMKAGSSMKLFAQGFTQRRALFDFVDAGMGKEQADNKIRECLQLFAGNTQCKHIIVGVCHDSGYAPFLSRFASDPSIRERITLLAGARMHPEIQNLGFASRPLNFASVFSPSTARGQTSSDRSACNTAGHRRGSSPPTPEKSESSASTHPRINPSPLSNKLGLLRDASGKRVDKPLSVNPSSPFIQLLRRSNLCTYYYLRGKCEVACGRSHKDNPLNSKEFDCLWYISRQHICFKVQKGKDCDDPLCVYGHETD